MSRAAFALAGSEGSPRAGDCDNSPVNTDYPRDVFMALVGLILVEASRAWYRVLRGPAPAPLVGAVSQG